MMRTFTAVLVTGFLGNRVGYGFALNDKVDSLLFNPSSE
jgi:hypothetical protein